MPSWYRSWILLPALLLMLAFVATACESSGDEDEADAGDDTEQVDDSAEDEAASEDEDPEDSEESSDATDEDSDASEDEESTDDAAADGEYPDVNAELGGPIVFGDFNWDSAVFHDRVAQFIIEHGYGHETDEIAGSTLPILQGIEDGDIHATMELWVQNMPDWYHEEVEAGTYVDVGNNYDGAVQGWFVPTYIIEGDEERGIEPMAPNLETVEDLKENWEIFEDPEDPENGRVYNGVGGWEATEHNDVRLRSYGLDEMYNSFLPGSEAALFTSLAREYELGEPWIGYLWTPSWPFAEYDLTLIEEPEYNAECWQTVLDATAEGGDAVAEDPCGFPAVEVNKIVSPEFNETAPHLVEFLENYTSNMELTNAALFYISENDATPDEAAEWWLQEYEDVWTEWVPADVIEGVQDAL